MSGVPYVDFYFPALLCSSSMLVAFFESTYGNFSKLTYQKIYSTMILSPLEPREIVLGEILWAATKGTLSAVGIALVGIPLGLTGSLFILPALGVIFASSFLFAALGMLVTSMVKNYDSIIYPTSGLIVPMSLLCGTYFPLDKLPTNLRYFTYLLPLTHSVASTRGLILKGFDWIQILHVFIILFLGIVFFRISARRIEQKLIQ
jgi:lipooligosaccharide transport system permease protein